MYDSIILRTVARIMLPLLLLLSLFMVLRGHNLPGGGFIGGLLAASGVILQIVAVGPDRARAIIPISYLNLAAVGVLVGAVSGLVGLAAGEPFMTAAWLKTPIAGIGTLGTPFFFDVGVYLTVIGVTGQLALVLAEEPELYPLEPRPAAGDAAAPEA